ncbi:MAG: indolepyruvate ferredoxin oxidoreductase subunit alpha [Chloroflexota bacterium]|nr:ferredoxin family protein [Dehalococcoidales bacterium]
MPIKIDAELCQGDGECVDACPVEVIAMEGDKAQVVNPDECLECEACVSACPHGAIEMV